MNAMNDSLGETHTSGSHGERAAIFRGARGSENVGPTLIPLRSPLQPPNAHHNKTSPAASMLFKGNRKCKEGVEAQMGPVPNPFPELLPAAVSLVSECLLPWTKNSATQVIKVYSEDNTSRAVEVPSDITARDICQLFILKNHCVDDHSWTLFEHIPHLGIERTIEDHEPVMEVQSSWGMDSNCCLYFRKNYAKYEFFKKPLVSLCVSGHMASCAIDLLGNRERFYTIAQNRSRCLIVPVRADPCQPVRKWLHFPTQG